MPTQTISRAAESDYTALAGLLDKLSLKDSTSLPLLFNELSVGEVSPVSHELAQHDKDCENRASVGNNDEVELKNQSTQGSVSIPKRSSNGSSGGAPAPQVDTAVVSAVSSNSRKRWRDMMEASGSRESRRRRSKNNNARPKKRAKLSDPDMKECAVLPNHSKNRPEKSSEHGKNKRKNSCEQNTKKRRKQSTQSGVVSCCSMFIFFFTF
jgi:hypothetical protein